MSVIAGGGAFTGAAVAIAPAQGIRQLKQIYTTRHRARGGQCYPRRHKHLDTPEHQKHTLKREHCTEGAHPLQILAGMPGPEALRHPSARNVFVGCVGQVRVCAGRRAVRM